MKQFGSKLNCTPRAAALEEQFQLSHRHFDAGTQTGRERCNLIAANAIKHQYSFTHISKAALSILGIKQRNQSPSYSAAGYTHLHPDKNESLPPCFAGQSKLHFLVSRGGENEAL